MHTTEMEISTKRRYRLFRVSKQRRVQRCIILYSWWYCEIMYTKPKYKSRIFVELTYAPLAFFMKLFVFKNQTEYILFENLDFQK